MACTGYHSEWLPIQMSLHVFTDLLVFTILFVIIRDLRSLTGKEKRGAYPIFALGFINILPAASLMFCNLAGISDVLYAAWGTDAWTVLIHCFNFLLTVQTATAVWIVCLPYCRRL